MCGIWFIWLLIVSNVNLLISDPDHQCSLDRSTLNGVSLAMKTGIGYNLEYFLTDLQVQQALTVQSQAFEACLSAIRFAR